MPGDSAQVRYLTTEQFDEIELSDVLRTLRLCDPDFDFSQAMTFNPVMDTPWDLWGTWKERFFEPILAPALVLGLDLACRGEVREMIELDTALSPQLAKPLRVASCDAGKALLHGYVPPAGDRILSKLAKASREGIAEANYVIVFAARCAVFNISLKQAVCTYLYNEWQSGGYGILRETDMPEIKGVFNTIQSIRIGGESDRRQFETC